MVLPNVKSIIQQLPIQPSKHSVLDRCIRHTWRALGRGRFYADGWGSEDDYEQLEHLRKIFTMHKNDLPKFITSNVDLRIEKVCVLIVFFISSSSAHDEIRLIFYYSYNFNKMNLLLVFMMIRAVVAYF